MPAFSDDSGVGAPGMSFSGSPRVIRGPRARALFEAAAVPSCAALIPRRQNHPHLLSVAEVLEGTKINKACQLCSRVVTCSPPCHFQLQSCLSGLRVIGVSRGRGAWGSEPGTPGRAARRSAASVMTTSGLEISTASPLLFIASCPGITEFSL